jgi:hypothetical protein
MEQQEQQKTALVTGYTASHSEEFKCLKWDHWRFASRLFELCVRSKVFERLSLAVR